LAADEADQSLDYQDAYNATVGLDADGNPITIDTEDDNSADSIDSDLIPEAAIDDSYQTPTATYDSGDDPSDGGDNSDDGSDDSGDDSD
jgi:hypothetical protein